MTVVANLANELSVASSSGAFHGTRGCRPSMSANANANHPSLSREPNNAGAGNPAGKALATRASARCMSTVTGFWSTWTAFTKARRPLAATTRSALAGEKPPA